MPPGAVPRLVRSALNWDLTPADVLRLVRADAHPAAPDGENLTFGYSAAGGRASAAGVVVRLVRCQLAVADPDRVSRPGHREGAGQHRSIDISVLRNFGS
jgi:hypothetical protein